MAKSKYQIKESALTKGEVRKLTALRKSLGDEIADKAFSAWFAQQDKGSPAKGDPNISVIEAALAPHLNKMSFPRGGGYTIKPGRGRVVVEPLT